LGKEKDIFKLSVVSEKLNCPPNKIQNFQNNSHYGHVIKPHGLYYRKIFLKQQTYTWTISWTVSDTTSM